MKNISYYETQTERKPMCIFEKIFKSKNSTPTYKEFKAKKELYKKYYIPSQQD